VYANESPSHSEDLDKIEMLSGYCGKTSYLEHVGECTRQKGRWDFTTLADCKQKCMGCDMCNYISYSQEWKDCSWYFICDQLHVDVPHFQTLKLKNAPPFRLLVTMSGQIRGGKAAWNSAIRNFITPNKADLALILHEAERKESILTKHATYLWRVPRSVYWQAHLDGMNTSSNWRRVVAGKHLSHWSPFRNGTTGIIRPMMHMYAFRNYMSNISISYTHHVITRTDFYYACVFFVPPILPQQNTRVVVPDVEYNNGVNDKWMLCTRASIYACFNLYSAFAEHPERFEDSVGMNVEGFTKTLLTANNLTVSSMSSRMFTIGASPKERNANAVAINQPKSKDEVFGLYAKVESEYRQTLKTCFRSEDLDNIEMRPE